MVKGNYSELNQQFFDITINSFMLVRNTNEYETR